MALTPLLVLDSTPLGLIVQKAGVQPADECRRWLASHLSAGVSVVVPEIVDYELRRELLRLSKTASLGALDAFVGAEPGRLLQLTSPALKRAAGFGPTPDAGAFRRPTRTRWTST